MASTSTTSTFTRCTNGSFELDAESPDTPLSRFKFREGDRFAYLYDMGDYWEHEVRIEQFLERKQKKTYPVCIGGSGPCPPEDCGGPPGYLEGQDEAIGLDAWSDMEVIAGFLAGLLEDRSAGSLSEDDWENLEDVLERMARREPFLGHEDIATTRIYAETSLAMLRRKFDQVTSQTGQDLVRRISRTQGEVVGAFAADLLADPGRGAI